MINDSHLDGMAGEEGGKPRTQGKSGFLGAQRWLIDHRQRRREPLDHLFEVTGQIEVGGAFV